jgi:AcrR family transcriptional regulator
MQAAIKETAWRQIAEYGAPALSLRTIARELGITAPAIYNYYPRRDDLVTALIVDAFMSLGDSQLAARDAVPEGDLKGRLLATGLAYRQWAITHPQRYQLIFGTPIPGYEAPEGQVHPISARSLSALVSVIEGLRTSGQLRIVDFPSVSPEDAPSLEDWQAHGGPASLASLSVAVLIWARVHGLVSLELSDKIPPFGPEGDALYRFELESIRQQFILEQS